MKLPLLSYKYNIYDNYKKKDRNCLSDTQLDDLLRLLMSQISIIIIQIIKETKRYRLSTPNNMK